MRAFGVDTKDIVKGEGRLGIYFLETGHGARNSEVIYDRKYSAISMASKDEFDIDKILDGVGFVHMSGITPALSKSLREFTIDFIKTCKERGILVSYDSNFRAKLWSLEEAREVLEEVLPYIDIAFLGHLDIINILQFENKGLEHEENLKDVIDDLMAKALETKEVLIVRCDE